jgi:hypothetical protein
MVHWWVLVVSGPNISELDNSEQFVATIFYSPTEITSDSEHKRLAQRIPLLHPYVAECRTLLPTGHYVPR